MKCTAFSGIFLLHWGLGDRKSEILAYNVMDENLDSNPNNPDWKGQPSSSLLNYLYCRVIVGMKVGVEGDEQSQAKVKADFRKDPGMAKLRRCQHRFGCRYELDLFLNPHTRVFLAIRHIVKKKKKKGDSYCILRDLHKATDDDRGYCIIQGRPLDMFCLVSTG